MNLRQARFDDHWRHVFARNYPTRFTQISFTNLSCIRDSTIHFAAGITAIIGSNGVGKSTLAAAVSELLSNGSEVAAGHRNRLAGSTTDGTVFQGDVRKTLSIRDGEGGRRVSIGEAFDGEFRWLDPSGLANACVNQIHIDQNFDDLLEPITPLRLASEELDLVSYVVGRKYTSFEIYEISDYGGLLLFPYFHVSSDGVSYGSEAMGRGELALMLTYWTLRDLPTNSILVVEEPETHVSPRSQDCLMNILAKFSDEMSIWTVIATHSPTIIRRLPAQHVKLISRERVPSAPVDNPTKTQVAAILGGGVAFQGVLLIEDEASKGFLLAILEKLDPDLSRQFDVVPAGSESDITSALSAMPGGQKWLTLVGVYDGDMRDRLMREEDSYWPVAFLPGTQSPEQLLKSMVENTTDIVNNLATELHKSAADVSLALDSVVGADCHDFLRGISAGLTLDVSMVRRGLVRVWLSQGGNMGLAKEFVRQLHEAVNGITRA
jgi:predicted ATPase